MFVWGDSIGRVLRHRMRQEHARREDMASRQRRVARFCSQKLLPALESLRPELEDHGRDLDIRRDGNIVHFTVFHRGRVEFRHSVLVSRRSKLPARRNGYYRDGQGYGRNVDQVYTLGQLRWTSRAAIVRHVVAEFRKVVGTSATASF